ncbi:hypothetical protein [Sporolactobacillus vineae]|uniref:hypothetical protein n=1 Tax=Sporolactobacillus vineae TaxID=444463 RepID=UPI001EE6455F|nr:hypothetical protein [Sporolactobacillus vineae]
MSDAEFKALINFYALFYGRIIIPDTFFINNQHLLRLIGTKGGEDYLKGRIIVPALRNNMKSLADLYSGFEKNHTLVSDHMDKGEELGILESVTSDQCLKWNKSDIAQNFTRNIAANLGNLELDTVQKRVFQDQVLQQSRDNVPMTRKRLRDLILHMIQLDERAKSTLLNYIDINYNFNIPNYFQCSAAYPERIAKPHEEKVSPDQVFFKEHHWSQRQAQVIAKNNTVSTSIFNMGILSSLQPDQILYIRKQKEYKRLMKSFRRMGNARKEEEIEDSIFDFIYMYENELPKIVTRDIKQQVVKQRKVLRIQTLFKGATNEGTDLGINYIGMALDGVEQMIGSRLIGQLVNIVTGPMAKKTQRKINRLDFKGRCKVEQLKNDRNIYDTIRSFSLNSLRK